jgi:predicted GIY-YIG superfamily endonuclease
MQFLYILELQQGKYYVGKTGDITRRLNDHCSGKGSEWTKKYPFVKLLHAESNSDPFDEDKNVKKLMLEKGIENVRGGVYSMVILSDEQIELLNRELRGAQNQCLKCGKPGHMIRDCTETTPKSKAAVSATAKARGDSISDTTTAVAPAIAKGGEDPALKSGSTDDDEADEKPKRKVTRCTKCNRFGHLVETCFQASCAKCGRTSHSADVCYAKTLKDGTPIE